MAYISKLLKLRKMLGLSVGDSPGTYVKNFDDESAYMKELPEVAKDGSVVVVGGKTVAMNQQIQGNDFTSTTNWGHEWSILSVSNHTLYVSIDPNSTGHKVNVSRAFDVLAHKYYCIVYANVSESIGGITIQIRDGNSVLSLVTSTITGTYNLVDCVASITSANPTGYIRIQSTDNVDDTEAQIVIKNMAAIDLTQMFGAGNEPTLEQCRKIFTADYYPYNTGSLVSAAVDKIITRKADGTVIAEYPIPAAVQALEGYGWSAGTVYNSIEYDATTQKWKFVKRVNSTSIGDHTVSSAYSLITVTINGILQVAEGSLPSNVIVPTYTTVNSLSAGGATSIYPDKSVGNRVSTNDIQFKDSAYSTPEEFKSAMSAVILYYALATPVETDITSLMGDFGEIKLAPNGFIEFHNSTNPALQLAVPNTVTYWQKVADEPDAGDALQLLTGMRGSNDAVNRNALNTLLGGDNV